MKFFRIPGFLFVILVVFLAGCSNPAAVLPPEQSELKIDPLNDPNLAPFTVDVLVGKDADVSRSIAGLDAGRIKGSNIRNIIQLIVVDDSGAIVGFSENRREKDTDPAWELHIDSLPLGQTYHFLLQMGHWNYTGKIDGVYTYAEAVSPTLLAAGLKEQLITGSGTVTITMWPLVVDTEFKSGGLSVGPVVNAGKPEAAKLLPVEWNVTWTIKRSGTGNGLADLVQAQQIPFPYSGSSLLLKGTPQTMVRKGSGSGEWSAASLSGNVVTQSLGNYTTGFDSIGKTGSVNFNLEYIPYYLTEGSRWSGFNDDSAFTLDGSTAPVWIIRNGVNDLAQTGATDFTNFPDGGANGNGGVRFTVGVRTPGEGSSLTVQDGEFLGSDILTAEIGFTTGGYSGDAEVYYAVVPHGAPPPDYSDYVLLDDTVPAGPQRETITIPTADGDYDIYVIAYQDGEVSDAEIISTKGNVNTDWIWGETPYREYYVASSGDDNNPGTKGLPLKTVQQALTNLATDYAGDTWPEKGTEYESPAEIIILDTVEVADRIMAGAGYPSIILRDDPETSGGKLKASSSIGGTLSLLLLQSGSRVILEGGLILEGIGNGAEGVYISGGALIMNGGVISGNASSGVSIFEGGNFVMNGGEISGNVSTTGGGVYISNTGTFTMNSGIISNNIGSGVYNNGTFTMNGGEISGNTAVRGGGVCMAGITFMTGGIIRGNTASISGGGVRISQAEDSPDLPSFNKTGGTIYGYVPDDPYSNKVEDSESGGILSDRGHAVLGYGANSHYRKETTLGPNDHLAYNYPGESNMSGW
jgi:hypothetical protein